MPWLTLLWEAPGDERAMEELTDLAKANIVAFEAHEREGGTEGPIRDSRMLPTLKAETTRWYRVQTSV